MAHRTFTSPVSGRRTFLSMLLSYGGMILWIGSLIFFGFAVAPILFKVLPSRDAAGAVNVAILARLNIIEFVAGALLIGGLLLFNLRLRSVWSKVPIALAAVMLIVTWVYSQEISPAMNALADRIESFDSPANVQADLKEAFAMRHIWYSRLVGVNLGLAFVIMIWQTLLFAFPYKFHRRIESTPENETGG